MNNKLKNNTKHMIMVINHLIKLKMYNLIYNKRKIINNLILIIPQICQIIKKKLFNKLLMKVIK